MKPSLEEERRALLMKIETSRAMYRRMLGGETQTTHVSQPQADPALSHPIGNATFPRSQTMKWVMEHPVAVATGVALLIWAVPRWWVSRSPASKARASGTHKADTHIHTDQSSEGTTRALITTAALLLRNPTTLRKLSRFAGSAWQWVQQHRANSQIKEMR